MTLEDIFFAAVEKGSPDERAAYLAGACGEDVWLRAQVEDLLRSHEQEGNLLDAPLFHRSTAGDPQDGCTSRESTIGPYQLLERIGEGGMGTVWLVEQQEPVRRQVALKLLKAGLGSGQAAARFEAERQALALMDHPNIARVHDGGATPAGLPYLVMELIKGVPITRYCDEQRLTPRQRLELFVPVCQAVQHAHQKGVIHRDLKPSNVLVAVYDGKPVPKVIDFGVAKAVGQPLTERTLVTECGTVVGTLEYMSPEQATLNNHDIDTRSDVYSLGVLLYELLTGTTPLERQRLKQTPLLESLRLIREEEPPAPSTRLSAAAELPTIATNRGLEPRDLRGVVRGELDWIVMKCLDKDRGRRYETANALAEDLQRHLQDEPVQACPPSAAYRLRKFVRRNRHLLVSAALVVLLLLASVIGLTLSNLRFAREKSRKEEALAEAEVNLTLARQAVDEMYMKVADQLSRVPEMQLFQRDAYQHALRFYQEFARRKSDDPVIRLQVARAILSMGDIQYRFGKPGEAEAAHREAIPALLQLVRESPADPEPRYRLATAHRFLGNMAAGAGQRHQSETDLRQALVLYRELTTEFPDKPDYWIGQSTTHRGLGNLFKYSMREGEKHSRDAMRLCEKLVAAHPEEHRYRAELVCSCLQLGECLHLFGQSKQAVESIRRAITVYEAIGEPRIRSIDSSLLPSVFLQLGIALGALGQSEEAETAYRKAIELLDNLVKQFPDMQYHRINLAVNYRNLSTLLVQTGKLEVAQSSKRSAVALFVKLAGELGEDPQSRDAMLVRLGGIAGALRDLGELHQAEKATRKGLEVARKLTAEAPGNASCRYRQADWHWLLGTILQRSSRAREAVQEYREVLAIFEKLAAEFPAEPDYRHRQALAANFLGILLRYQPTEVPAALQLHRQAFTLCEHLVAECSDVPQYWQQLIRSHYALGLARIQAGQWSAADDSFQQALAVTQPWIKLLRDSPVLTNAMVATIHNDLAWMLATCPEAKFRDAKRAATAARKAVELDPHKASYWNTRGVAEYRVECFQEAIAALEKSMAMHKGGDGFDWFFLAMAHWRLGEKDKARPWYAKAVGWMEEHRPKDKELLQFRGEAEALLNSEGKSSNRHNP